MATRLRLKCLRKEMQDLLNLAVKASLAAGRHIMEIYASGDFNVELKGDDSPLTRADVASHHAIMAHLESTGIPVLSEEGRSILMPNVPHGRGFGLSIPLTGPRNSSSATVNSR